MTPKKITKRVCSTALCFANFLVGLYLIFKCMFCFEIGKPHKKINKWSNKISYVVQKIAFLQEIPQK